MTAKEKAIELFDKYHSVVYVGRDVNKEFYHYLQIASAIILVDEIIKNYKDDLSIANQINPNLSGLAAGNISYWSMVKDEIVKMAQYPHVEYSVNDAVCNKCGSNKLIIYKEYAECATCGHVW